ncbi:hypothetical protein [Cupriavidus sp. YAF13]|uniref:hypothetical protein n=1 Tax=Cupriavidus sp. YAF13 TaxID=3233075 RepID=UPI003F8F0935
MSVAASWKTFSRRVINFTAGLQLGFTYFICGPLALSVVFGGQTSDLPIPDFDLSGSEPVLVYIALASIVFNGMSLLDKRSRNSLRNSRFEVASLVGKSGVDKRIIIFSLVWVILAVAAFYFSGKYKGGHWMESQSEAFSSSASASIVANFYNVFRVGMPGALLYACHVGKLSYRNLILVMLIFLAIELVVSSNRIIILFCLMAALYAVTKGLKKKLVVLLIISPLLVNFNYAFPIIRGLLWSDGANLSSMASSVSDGYDYRNDESNNLQEKLGQLVESSNLNVMKFVVDRFPSEYDYFYGETVFLKTATFIIPKAIWSDKPLGFGSFLGLTITGSNILALNATLLGEAFGNFGWFAIFIVPLCLFGIGRVWSSLRSPFYRYLSFFFAFACWRFDFSFSVISLAVLVAFNFGFRFAVNGRVKSRYPGM